MKIQYRNRCFREEWLNYFVISVIVIFLGSCKSTKFVSDGEHLLTHYSIECHNRKVNKRDLHNYIKQKPNKKIAGLRFHLSMYNLSSKKKNKGINKWLRKIGEEPVILDDYLTRKSVQQLKTYLNNKGFYKSEVIDTVSYHKNKKAKVIYSIKAENPYRIRKINYQIEDTCIRSLVYKDTVNSLLGRFHIFDADQLQKERIRLERLLRNAGYYNFSKEYVFYEADTTKRKYMVDLKLGIKQYLVSKENNELTGEDHMKYKIGNVYIYSDFNPKRALVDNTLESYDTIQYKNINILYNNELNIKPRIIAQSNYIQPGELYHLNNVDRTYKHLTSLKIYKYVNIRFKERFLMIDSMSMPLLDCYISLTPATKQSFAVENEVTNSSGNIGTAVNFIYQHKNFFKGAEEFNLKLKGAVEAIRETQRNKFKNTLELGSEASIRFPKFLFPILESEQFVKKYSPKTYISMSYNYQRRPDYTRAISNLAFGYYWESSSFMRHIIQPIEFNAVQLPYVEDNFQAKIDSIGSPYLQNSFNDHLVSVTSYSLIYNNQNIRKNNDFVYFRLNAETAGNVISGINEFAGEPTINGSYKFFDIEYAQYFKCDIDFSFHDIIDRNNSFVYRIFMGAGYPYGNSQTLPFEKRYFSGGANSIRAWQIRSLGPGSYNGETVYIFPNQTADIKLEANLEYRFKLFWMVEGALFIDAGNIWDIKKYEERDGGLFTKEFYRDIAIGTGFGTRFDFDFFLFRLDFGLKVRDPSIVVDRSDMQMPDNKWVLGKQKLRFGDNIVLNIGIGYPF